MPEPDFRTPTVYTRPALGFNFGTGSRRRNSTTPRQTAQRSSGFSFPSFFGNDSQFRTNNQYALDAVNNALSYPTVNTVRADGGGTNFLSSLRNTAGAILANMGSQGDGEEVQTFTPASFGATQQADGILGDPIVLIGLVVGAGALIWMVNK